jgi:hypothetical protein
VFLDESGVTTEMTRRYGWAPRPERVYPVGRLLVSGTGSRTSQSMPSKIPDLRAAALGRWR